MGRRTIWIREEKLAKTVKKLETLAARARKLGVEVPEAVPTGGSRILYVRRKDGKKLSPKDARDHAHWEVRVLNFIEVEILADEPVPCSRIRHAVSWSRCSAPVPRSDFGA